MRAFVPASGTLSGILIVALVLRLWGIDFGMPHALAHPDESRVARSAIGFLSGNLHPGFFNYPSLYMYVVGALDAVYCGGAMGAGRFGSLAECAASLPAVGEPFFLTGRFVTAFAGTLTVWLVFLLGRRCVDSAVGLCGAAFTAVAFLHVRDSHFGVTDVPMTALLVLAVLTIAKARDASTIRSFGLAGLIAGLAMSTKYNAALLVAPLAVALLQVFRSDAGASRGVRPLIGLAGIFAIAMLVGFLAGTPYAVLDFARFRTDAAAEAAHLTEGHGIRLGVGWWYHLDTTLRHGLTLPLLAAGIAGAIWMIVGARAQALLVLAFPVAYYAIAGRGYTVFARYMIPVVPFLCLSAGFAVVHAARAIASANPRLPSPAVAAILTVAIAAPSAWKSIQLDRLLTRTDSRVLAADWIAANVPAGDTIYQTGSHYGRPELSRRGAPPPFRVLSYDETAQSFRIPGGPLIEAPDWLVVQESPLTLYSRIPEVIQARLPGYQLTQAFRAIDLQSWHVFDQQDALFLPLAGFARVSRPGPNLYVYARRR